MDIVKDVGARWEIPADLRLSLLALLSADPTHVATMTYDEFMEWADEDTLAEWVDGRVVMTSPASARHQDIGVFLTNVLAEHARTHDLGRVLLAPFQMRLPTSGREPDVLFVAREHMGRVLQNRVEGPADLVVEIVSPESRVRDRGEKFYEYQEGGVGEYWLIDPDTRRVDFYQLDPDGIYQSVLSDADGVYRSRAMDGLWVRVAWLWQEPLPDVSKVMLEIDGAAYAQRLIADLTDAGFLPS